MAKDKTATLVQDNLPGFRGHAALFRCDPPIEGYEPWEEGQTQARHEYVIASAVNAFGMGGETYLFPANEAGEVTDWGELPPSQKGTLDHDRVFTDAGYVVVRSGAAEPSQRTSATFEVGRLLCAQVRDFLGAEKTKGRAIEWHEGTGLLAHTFTVAGAPEDVLRITHQITAWAESIKNEGA